MSQTLFEELNNLTDSTIANRQKDLEIRFDMLQNNVVAELKQFASKSNERKMSIEFSTLLTNTTSFHYSMDDVLVLYKKFTEYFRLQGISISFDARPMYTMTGTGDNTISHGGGRFRFSWETPVSNEISH